MWTKRRKESRFCMALMSRRTEHSIPLAPNFKLRTCAVSFSCVNDGSNSPFIYGKNRSTCH